MAENFKVTTKMPPLVDLDSDAESLLNLFDQENPDIAYFNLVDDENIKLSGSKLQIYKYMRSESFDDVYLEERNKTVANEPIECWGHYDPKPIEENLSEFGLELTNEQIFIFNKSYIERRIGRSLIAGDVVKPKFQEQKYEIFEVQESEFHGYGVYHLNCHAKLLRDHENIRWPRGSLRDNC